MTPTDEHIHAMIAAIPPDDRLPDGMPTPEALDRIVKSLSPTEQLVMAEREICRVGTIYMELLTAIGAAKRVGNDRYKRLRDITPAEDKAIAALVEAALSGPGESNTTR